MSVLWLSPRARAWAIFHCLPLLSSQYSYRKQHSVFCLTRIVQWPDTSKNDDMTQCHESWVMMPLCLFSKLLPTKPFVQKHCSRCRTCCVKAPGPVVCTIQWTTAIQPHYKNPHWTVIRSLMSALWISEEMLQKLSSPNYSITINCVQNFEIFV